MSAQLKKLSVADLKKKLKKVPEWSCNTKNTEISRTFPQRNFLNGLAFIARVTVHSEVTNHHPEIEFTYSKVKVTLTTHDIKGLTNADFELAMRIDNLHRD